MSALRAAGLALYVTTCQEEGTPARLGRAGPVVTGLVGTAAGAGADVAGAVATWAAAPPCPPRLSRRRDVVRACRMICSASRRAWRSVNALSALAACSALRMIRFA